MAPPQGQDSRESNSSAPSDPLPSSMANDAFARHDLKTKRSTISEMKRINALNLEPTIPKADDAGRNRISFKEPQGTRGPARNNDLKMEFQQSLTQINKQTAMQSRKKGGLGSGDAESSAKPKSFPFNPPAKGGGLSLNPNAADFTPTASSGAGPPAASPKPAGPAPQFSIKKDPEFSNRRLEEIFDPFFKRAKDAHPDKSAPNWPDANGPSYHEFLGKPDPGQRHTPQSMMPPAQGGGVPQSGAPANSGGGGGGGGGWQNQHQQQPPQQQPQQQQNQPQNPQQNQPQNQPQNQQQNQGVPQNGQDQGQMGQMGGGQPTMMSPGFIVPNPGQQGGQAMQMYPYMPGNMQNMVQQPGPPGGMPQQGGQQQGGMPGQQQQQPGQPQGQMVFPHQMMMAPGGIPGQPGQAMVPVGMVAPQQGQQPGGMNMGPMFNLAAAGGQQGQMMMVPMMMPQGGAFMPQQGFVPQQGMQGQPGHMMPQAMYHAPGGGNS